MCILSSKTSELKILCGELAQKYCGEFAPTRREMPLNSKICEVKKVLRRIGAKIVRRVCVNSPRRLSAVSSDLQNEQKCAASWRKNSAASQRDAIQPLLSWSQLHSDSSIVIQL